MFINLFNVIRDYILTIHIHTVSPRVPLTLESADNLYIIPLLKPRTAVEEFLHLVPRTTLPSLSLYISQLYKNHVANLALADTAYNAAKLNSV